MSSASETEIMIQLRLAGAEAAAAKLRNISKALKDPSLAKTAESLESAQKRLADLHQKSGHRATESVIKETYAVRKLTEHVEKLAAKKMSHMREEQRAARMAGGGGFLGGAQQRTWGSIIPGFMQGMGAGVFFRGGPHFLGGFGAGRVARFGAGLMRAPFMAGGLGAAAALLPLLGNTAAAGARMGLTAANKARSAHVDLQSLLESTGDARGLPGTAYRQPLLEQVERDQVELRSQAAAAAARTTAARSRPKSGRIGTRFQVGELQTGPSPEEQRIRAQQENAALRAEALKTSFTRDDLLESIGLTAKRYGMNSQAGIQRLLSTLTAASGSLDAEGVRLGETSMAAQRAFGLNAEAVGAFGRAGRISGQDPTALLNQGFADAVAAGMNRSETREYLETMSAALVQIRQTGLTLDAASLGRTMVGLRQAGLSPERATRMSLSMAQAAQQSVFQGGPQTGMDILRLIHMGGMRGNSMEDLAAASANLEGGGVPGGQQQFLQGLLRATGAAGASRRVQGFVLQALQAKHGVRASQDEWSAAAGARLPELSTAADVLSAGQAGVGESVARDAARDVQEVNAGARLLPSVQAIEDAQMRTVTTMSDFSDALADMAKTVNDISAWVNHTIMSQGYRPGLLPPGAGSSGP